MEIGYSIATNRKWTFSPKHLKNLGYGLCLNNQYQVEINNGWNLGWYEMLIGWEELWEIWMKEGGDLITPRWV